MSPCPKLDDVLLISANKVLGETENNRLLLNNIQQLVHNFGFTVSGNKAILAANEPTRPVLLFSTSRSDLVLYHNTKSVAVILQVDSHDGRRPHF